MHIELDFFVLYSSAASLGNVGQTSYSAANTFLDSFAGYVTHTVGKRCLSVNWGAIRIGELERNKEVARKVENTGYGLVDPQKGKIKIPFLAHKISPAKFSLRQNPRAQNPPRKKSLKTVEV